jgi:hypothetical protein
MHSTVARELPFIDEHAVEIAGPPERVWKVVRERAPRTGFRVAREEPPAALVLEGRHPFSRYRLGFHLDGLGPERVRVRARTDAAFPGPHGAAYRALVIGSGIHDRVMKRMMAQLKRAAERT